MKSANWLTNVILLILVITLSVLTYKTNQKKDIDNAVATLTHLIPEKARTIHIYKKDKHTVIKKQDATWFITKPAKVKANQFRIGSLLKLLTTTNFTEYSIDELDLRQYGLSDSELRVQVDNIDILFGDANPINSKRYILINDSMYLIEDNFFPLINSQLGTLVDQNLLSDDIEITQIKTSDFTLSRDKENFWKSSDDASSDDIVKTVTNWKNVQAFGVHDYVQRKTLDVIEVSLDKSTIPIRFLITDKEPWLIIARPELKLEYHFDKDNITKLLSTKHDEADVAKDQ